MIHHVNSLPLRRKGWDNLDPCPADLPQILYKGILVPTDHPNELEGPKKISEADGRFTALLIEQGHLGAVHRYDGVCIISIFNHRQNPGISHKRRVGMREGQTETRQGGQATDEITQSALMDDKDPFKGSIHRENPALAFQMRFSPGSPFNSSTFLVENPVENHLCQRVKSFIIRNFWHFA